jgi:hypothetical protein
MPASDAFKQALADLEIFLKAGEFPRLTEEEAADLLNHYGELPAVDGPELAAALFAGRRTRHLLPAGQHTAPDEARFTGVVGWGGDL